MNKRAQNACIMDCIILYPLFKVWERSEQWKLSTYQVNGTFQLMLFLIDAATFPPGQWRFEYQYCVPVKDVRLWPFAVCCSCIRSSCCDFLSVKQKRFVRNVFKAITSLYPSLVVFQSNDTFFFQFSVYKILQGLLTESDPLFLHFPALDRAS